MFPKIICLELKCNRRKRLGTTFQSWKRMIDNQIVIRETVSVLYEVRKTCAGSKWKFQY